MLAGKDSREAKKDYPRLRLFYLVRDEDVSGVSGVGRVALGVVFPSRRVVLEWLGADRSFEILDNLEHVERIHGHGGKTRIVFTSLRRVARLERGATKGPFRRIQEGLRRLKSRLWAALR